MKGTGRDVPVSVAMVTVVVGAAEGLGGTVAVQVVDDEQETAAVVPPKDTVMCPDGLKKPVPLSVTVWPGAAADGVSDASTGAPGAGGGGAAVVGGADVGGGRVVAVVGAAEVGAGRADTAGR